VSVFELVQQERTRHSEENKSIKGESERARERELMGPQDIVRGGWA